MPHSRLTMSCAWRSRFSKILNGCCLGSQYRLVVTAKLFCMFLKFDITLFQLTYLNITCVDILHLLFYL